VKITREISLMAIAALVLGVAFQTTPAHAQNTISTVVGGATTPTTPLTADLPGPTSAVRDSAGNTYIAAPLSNNIFKLTAAGSLSVFSGLGYGGYNGDGELAALASLGNPATIVIDSNGNIFFVDYGSSRVRRIDAVTGDISTVAGSGVKCDISTNPCGDGGLATAADLNLPEALAIDSAGNLYIADAVDNRIREVTASTGTISTVAGSGAVCTNPSSACGDGASATAAQLNFPMGVAVDAAGNLYISDTLDQRVRVVSGGVINAFAGTGGYCRKSTGVGACGDGHTATLASLYRPQHLIADASGNVYIADTFDHKIRVVNGGIINSVAGTGAQGFSGDGGQATSAQLDLPVGISEDSSGNLVISDTGNQRIRVVTTAGVISTLAGGGNGGDGGPATSALLAGPYAITEDSNGNLYIADTGNNRIRKISNGTISTIAGTGSAGYTGDGGPAISATMSGPTSVAVDSQGNIFFSDYGNLVVREIVAGTGNVQTVAGNGTSCYPTNTGCGDGGLATLGNLTSPQTVALDASDNLYIADNYAFKIRKVTASTQIISTVAGTGVLGSSGDGKLATKATLSHPTSAAVDSNGNIYISDQYNNKIRMVTASTGLMSTYALNGSPCLCFHDGGPALQGSMWNPLEVAIDPSNNLFIGGGNDNVVQRVDSLTLTWGTVAGNALAPITGGFTGDGGLATKATLSNFGLVVDKQSNLYIADEGNNRIRLVHLTPAATLPAAPLNFGNIALNTQSAAKTVTLTSSGGVDLTLSSAINFTGTNANLFAQTNTCGTTLPINLGVDSTCTVSATFTPTTYGQFTANLTFTDNGPNSPQTVQVNGSGPDFGIMSSSKKITVGLGKTGTVTLTLVPIAGFNQTIALTCNGAPTGVTCTPNPTSVTLNGTTKSTSLLSIVVASTTAPGTYTLTALGQFFPLQHPATITLTVP
jgi:sugar lactone lactonase YvrE